MFKLKKSLILLTLLCTAMLISGCVDQSGKSEGDDNDAPRVVATSPAVAEICSKLDIPLVGVCETEGELPKEYKDLPKVGMAMAPDLEILKSLKPDYVLSPSSLESDLKPKYEGAGIRYEFLDLKSVDGMYSSIEMLGEKFGKEEQAKELKSEYEAFMKNFNKSIKGKKPPKVLILMGLPGSYIVATENSYVGSLVELAGGENVYAGTKDEFLTVNTEDMKTKEPDIILRTAHAMPEDVKKMFEEEFATNDIWKHFSAVENGKVYDLDSEHFGMSAKFNYPDAMKQLQEVLYENK